MSRAGLDDVRCQEHANARPDAAKRAPTAPTELAPTSQQPRRTPSSSLIVVLPDNHVVSPDRLAEQMPADRTESIHVIVACAGQPVNLPALQRKVRDAQFLLAPAGTSTEDLRELAMSQAPADIVSLLNGITLPAATASE